MSGRHDEAAKLALLKAVDARLKDARAAADGEIREGWRPGDRNTAVLPDGAEIGTVTLTKGRAKAVMDDEAAFEAWVKATHPEQFETVTVTRVRPEFRERLMSAARQLGHPVDAETGEEVPGITVTTGEPYPMVKLAPDAPALIAAAWQSGGLAEVLAGLFRPELESGADS